MEDWVIQRWQPLFSEFLTWCLSLAFQNSRWKAALP